MGRALFFCIGADVVVPITNYYEFTNGVINKLGMVMNLRIDLLTNEFVRMYKGL